MGCSLGREAGDGDEDGAYCTAILCIQSRRFVITPLDVHMAGTEEDKEEGAKATSKDEKEEGAKATWEDEKEEGVKATWEDEKEEGVKATWEDEKEEVMIPDQRRQSSGSNSVSRRGQPIAPRLSEMESSPISPAQPPQWKRESSLDKRTKKLSKSRSGRKVVVIEVDMPEEVQKKAIDCARQAMEEFEVEKDIAGFIKKEFDKNMGATWHCIVGQQFGSFVTYEKNCFIYFYSGQVAFMLFRSG